MCHTDNARDFGSGESDDHRKLRSGGSPLRLPVYRERNTGRTCQCRCFEERHRGSDPRRTCEDNCPRYAGPQRRRQLDDDDPWHTAGAGGQRTMYVNRHAARAVPLRRGLCEAHCASVPSPRNRRVRAQARPPPGRTPRRRHRRAIPRPMSAGRDACRTDRSTGPAASENDCPSDKNRRLPRRSLGTGTGGATESSPCAGHAARWPPRRPAGTRHAHSDCRRGNSRLRRWAPPTCEEDEQWRWHSCN